MHLFVGDTNMCMKIGYLDYMFRFGGKSGSVVHKCIGLEELRDMSPNQT